MLKTAISAFLVSVISFCYAQQTDTLNVQLNLEKGQKFILQVNEATRSFENGELTSETLEDYGIKLSVLEKSSEGYLLEFDHRDFLFFDDNPTVLDQISHLDKGLKIEVITDEYGAFVQIKNWEELRDNAHKMLDDIRITLGYNQDLVASFDTLKSVLSTRTKLEDHFLQEGQNLLLTCGMHFEKGNVFTAPAMLPTLFSNDSIPTVVSLGLKQIKKDIATIFYLQTFQQKDVKDFVVDELAFFTGLDIQTISQLGVIDFFMEQETDLRVNVTSGLCQKFIHRTVVKIDDFKSVIRTTVEIKEIK